VAELESTWRKTRNPGDTRRCIVDLTEMTAIDRSGEAALAEIMTQGVEFIASDVYTKHLLRNLRNTLKGHKKKGR
jgi:hypothetical protein